MAAPGYVWLLFPNPLNSTAIRQPKLQLVFSPWNWKGICLSQHSLKSPNEKEAFVLKCHLWTGMTLEAMPVSVWDMHIMQPCWCWECSHPCIGYNTKHKLSRLIQDAFQSFVHLKYFQWWQTDFHHYLGTTTYSERLNICFYCRFFIVVSTDSISTAIT